MVVQAGFAAERETMEILANLKNGARLFAAQPVLYLLIGAVVAYGSLFSFGILSGPLIGGFLNVGLAHHRTGRPPRFADVIGGVQNLGNLLLLSLLIALCWVGMGILLPALLVVMWWAYIPLFILVVALATWWMYTPALIADQKMGLRKAMQTSRARVTESSGFFAHLGFLVCVFILPPLALFALSALFPLASVLNFLVCPLQFLTLACAYEQAFEKEPRVVHFCGSTGEER
jgi:hypothetical protein